MGKCKPQHPVHLTTVMGQSTETAKETTLCNPQNLEYVYFSYYYSLNIIFTCSCICYRLLFYNYMLDKSFVSHRPMMNFCPTHGENSVYSGHDTVCVVCRLLSLQTDKPGHGLFNSAWAPKRRQRLTVCCYFSVSRFNTELKVFDSHRRMDKEQLSIKIRPLPSLYQAIFDWFHLQ